MRVINPSCWPRLIHSSSSYLVQTGYILNHYFYFQILNRILKIIHIYYFIIFFYGKNKYFWHAISKGFASPALRVYGLQKEVYTDKPTIMTNILNFLISYPISTHLFFNILLQHGISEASSLLSVSFFRSGFISIHMFCLQKHFPIFQLKLMNRIILVSN